MQQGALKNSLSVNLWFEQVPAISPPSCFPKEKNYTGNIHVCEKLQSVAICSINFIC